MIGAFLDSNVLISALIGSPRAAPVVMVDWLVGNPSADLMTGRCCIQEVSDALERKLPAAVPIWRRFIAETRIRVVTCPRLAIPGINAKDSTIVAAAIRSKARYFVTGDKRLLREMRAAGSGLPAPVTPRELLEALLTAEP